MEWTDERVAELARLWEQGLTTADIGKILGVSKNAVVGKAHRIGLAGRPSPIKRKPGERAARTPPPPPKPKGKSVVELNAVTCRWPIGDPKDSDFHFCGKKAAPGKPYCAEHAQIAYVRQSKRDENAA